MSRTINQPVTGKVAVILLIKTLNFTELGDFGNAWKALGEAKQVMDKLTKKKTLAGDLFSTEFLLTKANIYYRQGEFDNILITIKEAVSRGINKNTNRSFIDFNFHEISAYRATTQTFIKALRLNPDVYYSFVKDYRTIISTNPGYVPLVEGDFCTKAENWTKPCQNCLPPWMKLLRPAARGLCCLPW